MPLRATRAVRDRSRLTTHALILTLAATAVVAPGRASASPVSAPMALPTAGAAGGVHAGDGEAALHPRMAALLVSTDRPAAGPARPNPPAEAPVPPSPVAGTARQVPGGIPAGVGARAGPPVTYRQALRMEATGYDRGPASTGKRPGDPAFGLTATGLPAGYGVVAVDPAVIPLGSRLYVAEYGFAVAGDTGHAITGLRIDLGFATHAQALAWGRRTVTVFVL